MLEYVDEAREAEFLQSGLARPFDGVVDIRRHLATLLARVNGTPFAPEAIVRQQRVFPMLGTPIVDRNIRFMATIGKEDLGETDRLRQLIAAGIDIFRINSARDRLESVNALCSAVSHASKASGRDARIFIDLEGPKLRTSAVSGTAGAIKVRAGDELVLQGSPDHVIDRFDGDPLPTVSVPSLPETLPEGARIVFDDGKAEGIIIGKRPHGFLLRVTFPERGSATMRSSRSVNLPESPHPEFTISQHDREMISLAPKQADILSISFARTAEDVDRVITDMPSRTGPPGVVVKIENGSAVKDCVGILLAAMKREEAGMLIARGDLAAECGFERLPALQERLFLLARAAAVPVFIATGVLDQMTRKGRRSRAEMIDVASALRADCVMLNRGDGIAESLLVLQQIHQFLISGRTL
jgi:pyruvate kinase